MRKVVLIIVVMLLALHDVPKLLFEFPLIEKKDWFDKKLLGTKTVVDSMAEFALEKCAMVQNHF